MIHFKGGKQQGQDASWSSFLQDTSILAAGLSFWLLVWRLVNWNSFEQSSSSLLHDSSGAPMVDVQIGFAAQHSRAALALSC